MGQPLAAVTQGNRLPTPPRTTYTRRRDERRAKGVCTGCGEARDRSDRRLCARCREYKKEASRRQTARRSRHRAGETKAVPEPVAVVRTSAKPLIGMNADYQSARNDGPAFSYICAGYFDSLIRVGAVPIVIPPLEDETDLNRILDFLDGMVMIGGADLDPRHDGFMFHPSVRTLDPRREQFDRMLMRLIGQRRTPVLGVGLGMQLLNVSQGGNLFLHIPEDTPRALPHLDPVDPAHRHALEVKPGSLMERVYGEGEIRVNSMHHMAVDEVAHGFSVTARCPDGVVEAIESEMGDWFAFAIQFHPESDSASALDLRIFEEFLVGVTGNADRVESGVAVCANR